MLKKLLSFAFFVLFIALQPAEAQTCSCDSNVTTFNVNLSANPDTTWSISSTRNGYCCSASGNDRCVKFDVTTHPNATQVGFNVTNPSPPGGAFYQVNCGTPTSLGTPLCVTNNTSFCITYCKSGNDNATYTISTSQGYATSSDISVREGCTDFMFINGMQDSTINWTSVAPGAVGAYDSYLSCTSACDTTYVTPAPGSPSYIDYQVSGYLTGCSSSLFYDTVRVFISPGMSVDVSPDTAYVCSGSTNASLTANATGGAPPYSYTWSNGDTTQSITVGAGTYWVDVQDTTSNCPPLRDSAIVLSQPPVPMPTAGSNSPICAGDTLDLTASTVSGATYNWFGPNGFSSTQQNPSIPNITLAGAGTYYLYATLNSCNSDTDSVAVTINPQPAPPTASNNGPLCVGDQLSLSASNVAGATYNWTGPNGFSSTQQNPFNSSVTLADSGYYYVTVTVSGCTSNEDSTRVVINPKPAPPTASSNSPVCVGQTINLSATNVAGASYSWTGPNSFSSTQQNPSITNSTTADSGWYKVTVTVGGCTSNADSTFVSVDVGETANAGSDQTVCADATSVALSGTTSTGSGSWSTSGTGSFSPSSTNLNTNYIPSAADTTAGSVSLYLSSTNNGACGAAEDTVVITFSPEPVAIAGADQTVCANNADVNLSGTVWHATGGMWITSGDGNFNPSNTILNPTYSPGTNDTTNGSVTLTLITTGNGICSADSSSMLVTITSAPIVNAGADQAACKSNPDITLNGTISGPTSTGQWSTSGSGTFSPSNTNLNATYSPSSADTAAGSVNIILTSTNNGNCNPVTDTMTITYINTAIADAGSDVTVCANNADVTLNGSSTTGSGQWFTSGSGTFSPNDSTLNATYSPSSADTAAGSVTLTLVTTNNGTCTADSSSMIITITDAPTANPGPDQSICKNNLNVSLNGSVTIATGGYWITSGDGSFTPSDSLLNTTYVPGTNDTANGSVTLTLVTSGNGSCLPDSASMLITFTPAPVVDAGVDQTACKSTSSVPLNGSVTGPTTTGQWSTSGSGSFSPSNTNLSASYLPSSADTAAGSVNIILTSTNNGNCNPVTDTMVINFIDPPVADAGNNVSVCANNADVTLNGTSSTGTGKWYTSGSGTFSPNDSTLNATYSPSSADTAAGSVTLSLVTTGNGLCPADTSTMTITITNAPVADAGPDQSICANNATITLNGSVSVASGGKWVTSGDGTFSPSDTVLNTSYTAGTNDTANGSVTLTLVTTGNGNCLPDSNSMILTFTPAPVVDAGVDQTACKSTSSVPLNGSVTGPTTTGQWSTSGSGSFSPSNTNLSASYLPSSADTTAGSVNIILTSTNNGTCNPVTDTMVITFTDPPVADAGNNVSVCANNADVTLNGTSSTGTGKWYTSGSGTFSPDDSTLNATYSPSSADTAAGSVTLSLVTTNNGLCPADTSTMTITITDAPVADPGPDQTICANNATANLNGSVSVASGGKWFTSGDGTFSPSDTVLNTSYTAGTNDTANGSVTLTLVTTGNGNCLPDSATLLITIIDPPTVDAGNSPIYTCLSSPTTQLNGSSSTGTGQWASMGTGTFSPNNTTLTANYVPSSTDTANGSVKIVLTSTNNGNCLPVTDTVEIIFTPIQIVEAGNDTSLCANNAQLPLNGSVTNGSPTGVWSTTGSGTFSPDDSTLNATYIPSSADTAAGSVDLILTSTFGCEAVSDTLTLTITPAPHVDAGPDLIMCKNNPDASLSGTVSNGFSTGVWSTPNGTGTFSPDTTTLNATYSPSSADTTNGSVTIVLTSTNNGNCLPVTDTMIISYIDQPSVDAGTDQTVCANNSVQLNGNVIKGSGTGQWSSPNGTGTFTPSDTSLTGQYNFSSADTTNGSVTLVLTSTNNGNCLAETDTMEVTITPAPTADAGSDVSVCANNDTVPLNGNVTIAQGGKWSSTGDGVFMPSDTLLSTNYIPGSNDSSNGSVQIILTTTQNGLCDSVSDTMTVTITPAPVVDAGTDQYICQGTMTVNLNGSVTGGASTGQWSSSGTGTFSPSSTTLNATYNLSSADSAAGSFTLTLTSTSNGSCLAEADSMTVYITTLPTVDAGTDTTVCSTLDSLQMSGQVTGGSGTGQWTTSGSGYFSPVDTVDSAYYVFSPQDTTGGSVTLYYSAIQSCSPQTDSIVVSIIKAPVADAGSNSIDICEGETANLNGSISNASNAYWSSSGTGQFVPDSSALNGSYVPSSADIDSGYVDLYLTITDSSICINELIDTMRLNIGSLPVAGMFTDPACANQSSALIDSSTIQNGTLGSWIWIIGTDTLVAEDTSYTFGSSGTFTIQHIVGSNAGCYDTVSQTVTINPVPQASFSFDNTCSYDVDFTDLSSISSGNIVSWDWNFGDGDSLDIQNPSHTYLDTGIYIVTLTVTSDSGCTSSYSDTVQIFEAPIAAYEPEGGTYEVEELISFTDLSTNAASWLWDFDDGNNSTDQNPEHGFSNSGTYDVLLEVTGPNGCTDTISYAFVIEDPGNTSPVAVPTAFTPNGDGENDKLFVVGGPLNNMAFRVFNEWGNEIFYTTNQSEGWDGSIGGTPQPNGTYIYILTGETQDGEKIEMAGEVNLIR